MLSCVLLIKRVSNYTILDKHEETICQIKWYKLIYFNIIVSAISLIGSIALLLAIFKYRVEPLEWVTITELDAQKQGSWF